MRAANLQTAEGGRKGGRDQGAFNTKCHSSKTAIVILMQRNMGISNDSSSNLGICYKTVDGQRQVVDVKTSAPREGNAALVGRVSCVYTTCALPKDTCSSIMPRVPCIRRFLGKRVGFAVNKKDASAVVTPNPTIDSLSSMAALWFLLHPPPVEPCLGVLVVHWCSLYCP